MLLLETSVEPFSLDKTDWISPSLRWFSRAPDYTQDFLIYIWQPQIEFPKLEVAQIFTGAQGDIRNVLVTFDLTGQSGIAAESLFLHEPLGIPHSKETEIILAIFSCYVLLIRDTSIFLDTMLVEIDSMVSRISLP
jgi:hypothetical protein